MFSRRIMLVLSGVCAVAALSLVTAPLAQASSKDEENLYSMEACEYPGYSKFKLHLYYNSAGAGSYRNIGYSVYDFNAVRPGGSDPGAHPLRFCPMGASNPWPGSGQKIKNNAASGENDHSRYKARIYDRSGYKGNQDVMAPYQHIDQFRHNYNDNASFKWTSR
ncbi:hypothetical protein [Streptomyces bluensis]|uniref:hypothetical protein n=1 Tax=Streptomyces bluensis TaxID=33897 RepID=UPI0033263C05